MDRRRVAPCVDVSGTCPETAGSKIRARESRPTTRVRKVKAKAKTKERAVSTRSQPRQSRQ